MDYTFNASLGHVSHNVAKLLGENFMKNAREASIEISSTEWFVLSLLYHKSGCKQKDIKQSMNMNKVKLTRLLARMEEKQLIMRKTQKKDKRYKQVQLTDKGKELYLRAEPVAKETLNQAFEGFTPTEYVQLMAYCNRVIINLSD